MFRTGIHSATNMLEFIIKTDAQGSLGKATFAIM